MLKRLINFLQKNGLYFIEEIKNIDKSCCLDTSVKVLNFDKLKNELSKTIPGLQGLKSVDGLFIYEKNHTIFFIEMCSIKNYLKNPNNSSKDPEAFVREQFYHELQTKIVESIFILLTTMGYFGIDKNFYSYFLNPNDKLKIKTILLSDFTYSQLLKLRLGTLHKQNINIIKRVEGEIQIFNCLEFEGFFDGKEMQDILTS